MSIYRITEHGATIKEYGVRWKGGDDHDWYYLGYQGELHQYWNECNARFDSIDKAEVFINQIQTERNGDLIYNIVKEIRFE